MIVFPIRAGFNDVAAESYVPSIMYPCPVLHQMNLTIQWNLSIKDTLNKGHLSNEDTVCSANHIELCTNLPLNLGRLSIQDSQLGPSGVLYREVPPYTRQPAGSQ